MRQEEVEFVNQCKQIVLQAEQKEQPNLLGYLRTKDESLKDCRFFSDGVLTIWLSKDEQTLYVRAIYPEPTQLIYINSKEDIEVINEAIKHQFSHVHTLLRKGFIDVYVCPFCGGEHLAKDWDKSTIEPLEGRTVRGYKSIMLSNNEYNWQYICPTCKQESFKKKIISEKRELKG